MPVAVRQAELKESYCFTCACDGCKDFEKDVWVEGLMCKEKGCKGVAGHDLDRRVCNVCGSENVQKSRRDISVSTVATLTEAALVECYSDSYKLSHARLTAGNELAMRYIDQQRFGEAAVVMNNIIEAMEFCLFENSPVVGVGLYKLVKLLEYEETQLELAGRLRSRAQQILLGFIIPCKIGSKALKTTVLVFPRRAKIAMRHRQGRTRELPVTRTK
jgi:hypothetical protein